jgi:hypothetical protein
MNGIAFAPDAAFVLGIASTAMPFARTREAEAERWLRVLRLRGEAGLALEKLGVSEAPLAPARPSGEEGGGEVGPADRVGGDAVASVTEQAVQVAARRGSSLVATSDVLIAVMCVYGESFERVLQTHGADNEELLAALGAGS